MFYASAYQSGGTTVLARTWGLNGGTEQAEDLNWFLTVTC